MLHMGARVGRGGAVVEKFADADVARDLHLLDVLVDELLDDKRLFDIYERDVRRALVGRVDDDRADAVDALEQAHARGDIRYAVWTNRRSSDR